jgi:uncharacterized protein YaiE (UPF0345 family)
MMAESARQKEAMREAFKQQVATMLANKTYSMNDFIREMKVRNHFHLSNTFHSLISSTNARSFPQNSAENAKKQAGVAAKVQMMFQGKPEELKQLEASVSTLEKMSAEERTATEAKWFNLARKQEFVKRISGDAEAVCRFPSVQNWVNQSSFHTRFDDIQMNPAELEKFNDLLRQFDAMVRMHAYLHWRKSRYLPQPQSQEQLEIMMRDTPAAPSKSTKMKALSMSRSRIR